MTSFTPEKARERALHDWESRSVRKLVVGTLDITRPCFYWGELFYTESISCDYTDEVELFCRTYNLTVCSLLARYGVPTWAPVKRLPDAHSCLTILADESLPFSGYNPTSPQENMAVNRVLFRWRSARPARYVRQLSLGLLFLGGSLEDQSGRVDVLDVLNGETWLAFYTYARKEFPRFPWDESGSAVSDNS
jgi:hypothetical protein